MFKSLNDANGTSKVDLSIGTTEIWFAKSEYFCQILPGDVDKKDLGRTHIKLGQIAEKDLNSIYYALQGEVYSPNGEARELIRSKGLTHTSISMSDVIVKNGEVYFVDMSFTKI